MATRQYEPTGDKFIDEKVEHLLSHPTVKEMQKIILDSIEEGKRRGRKEHLRDTGWNIAE
jgi:hypothetical protein